ncbi:hypothetical protein D9M72_601130 [compost metagenome]
MSWMTSRGVKCSPAVSLEASAKRRMSSSNMRPISMLLMVSGWRSIAAKSLVTW